MNRRQITMRRAGRHLSAALSMQALAVVAAVYASAAPAVAQDGSAVCPEGRITDVVVDNHSVFDLEDADAGGRFEWAYRLANALHIRTKAEVVEREILVEPGDCYDVELMRDSERLLRSFEFLANAEVYGIRMPGGQVQVIVDTQDEWSTRIEPRLGSGGALGLRGLRLVEENLLGTGQRVGIFYDQEEEDGERIYGAEYRTPQLFGSRWDLGLQVARTEVGQSYSASVAYPFVGEAGTWASRQAIQRADRYFEIFMPDADGELARIWMPVRREQFDVGMAVRRSGGLYRHTLLGVSVAGERVDYPGEPRFVDAEDESRTVPISLAEMWPPLSSARIMVLAGQRNIWFVRRRGLETINAVEDMQLGVEAEASIGPTLPGLSETSDIAAGLGLFAAAEPLPGSIVGGQFRVQARRSYEAVPGFPEWNDILAEASGWAYLKPSLESRHLLLARVTGVGGWHPRAPFQLTLGRDTGLRGYERNVDPGAKRVVATLEHRAFLRWPLPSLFDFGSVAFVDVGKIWPGDVPFGTESPIRSSVGFGIRAAFPPGSRQMLRVDVGFPVDGTGGFGSPGVSARIGIAVGPSGLGRDGQLARSAWYSLESADFGYASGPQ